MVVESFKRGQVKYYVYKKTQNTIVGSVSLFAGKLNFMQRAMISVVGSTGLNYLAAVHFCNG